MAPQLFSAAMLATLNPSIAATNRVLWSRSLEIMSQTTVEKPPLDGEDPTQTGEDSSEPTSSGVLFGDDDTSSTSDSSSDSYGSSNSSDSPSANDDSSSSSSSSDSGSGSFEKSDLRAP